MTGRHDSNPVGGVLYVGQADDLSVRMSVSIHECLSETHANGQKMMCSDVWDLTVRWARLSGNLLDEVERLLIMSHAPPFNSQGVRRGESKANEFDLVVMNAGRRGAAVSDCGGRLPDIVAKQEWRNWSVTKCATGPS